MRKIFLNIFTFVFMAVSITTAYSVQAQVRAYRVTDRQVQTLITRIETRTDNFRRVLDRNLDRSVLNSTRSEDAINTFVADFERATDELRRNFDARRSTAAQVQEVLYRANIIEGFVRRNRLNPGVEQQWILVRNDLNLLANYYNVSWTWGGTVNAPVGATMPYYVTDAQLQDLLARIEQRSDVFKRQVSRSLDRSTINGTRSEDSLNRFLTDFENSTDRLRQRFNSRQSVSADVESVLMQARMIDNFVRDNRLSANAESSWNLLRNDLNTLASYYRLTWDWNSPVNTGGQVGAVLTGTYQLNPSQSDNVSNIINTSITQAYGSSRDERIRRNLERRLSSPETLVLDQRNNQVTIASNVAPQVTFDADGVKRTETNTNGRTVNIRAVNVGGGVEVSYEGDRANDFYLTFMPMNNGQLRVTRRVYLENRNQTVTVNSVYDKVSQYADFSRVNSSTTAQNYPSSTTVNNDFIISNGTQLVASLTRGFSTSNANEGDRFTMEVQSPSQYSGAVIEGYVSNTQRSGRVSGRAQVTFNFDTIRLRNGATYRFSGLIDQVRQPNGETVSVNNEGAVRDSNQTTRTVTRAGIGAAIGAIIGAIAGGGQGAAIGAGIGAGAGAGTVILQGRDNLELQTGAQFTITSSAPAGVSRNY